MEVSGNTFQYDPSNVYTVIFHYVKTGGSSNPGGGGSSGSDRPDTPSTPILKPKDETVSEGLLTIEDEEAPLSALPTKQGPNTGRGGERHANLAALTLLLSAFVGLLKKK